MQSLLIDSLPELRDPAIIVAFSGWGDAGEASTAAVRWLVRQLRAPRVGGFDPEYYHVLTDTRPTVRYEGDERRITWPAHHLFAAGGRAPARDLLILSASEPELRWRTYSREIISLARRVDAEIVVSLGGFLADAPHTRPTPVSGFATTPELWDRLQTGGVAPSDYRGPAGIVSALHAFCKEDRLPSASLWASVPHYLPTTANPKAALALLRYLDSLIGLGVNFTRLERAAQFFERRVDDAVRRDGRVGGYLHDMEERADAAQPEPSPPSGPLPSADEVIRDLEDFLRGRPS